MMKFLTLDFIKQHSRIDFDCEDGLLELYGEAAEATIFELCRCNFDGFLERYGEMPKALVQAALMLVDVSYTHRAPVNPTSISLVPYTFDVLVKPYMTL